MDIKRVMVSSLVGLGVWAAAGTAFAECDDLPSWSELRAALVQAVKDESSGLDFNMWGTLVDRDGTVCVVAFSGNNFTDQWLGSRVISAQKANTANDFSLSSPLPSTVFPNGLALSTANLYSAVQPGGSLYGLQHSNPVDPTVAYAGKADNLGAPNDPMVGKRVGGVNVFGGGLALYVKKQSIGGVGVSGDTSCADHMIAWRLRHNLNLDQLKGVGGVSGDPNRPDNIVYDITPNPSGGTGNSAGGFGHPKCIRTGDQTTLPAVR